MPLFNPAASGSGAVHDVLLIAGSRPEAARLAPVAGAMVEAGRIEPVLVAAGADPMAVHDALEAMGAPAAVTLLLGEQPHSKVAAAAALAVRLDELMADRDPSAVLLTGAGITAVVAAQVAFWRQIPVVYLEPEMDLAAHPCPFPGGGNRRVISQLTSLFLRAGEEFAPSAPGGPNTIVVGDTMAASPMFDGTLAELGDRARAGLTRIVLVDAGTESAVAAVPGLLDSQPDVNVVFVGRPRDAALVGHPRVDVLAHTAVPDLVAMLSVSTVAVTDRYRAGMEALEFGLPTVLVERAGRPSTMPGQVPADPAAVLTAITQLLADHPEGRCRNADPAAASRAEHALAWMFGLAAHPVHGSTDHGSTDHGSTGHDSTGQPNAAANAEE